VRSLSARKARIRVGLPRQRPQGRHHLQITISRVQAGRRVMRGRG
jgi:hypothetical protein